MSFTIRELGNQLLVNIDGYKFIGYPTGGGLWIVSGYAYGPDPGDPDPENSFAWPFPTSCVSSEYGPRNGRIHQGIDFSTNGTGEAFPGADIPASFGGTVSHAEGGHSNLDGSGFGNHVILNHGVINDRQIYTVYAHMVSTPLVSNGDTVSKGQIIGNVGNTGNSYGAHLHFETHIANPGNYISWANPGTHLNPRDFMAVYGE